MTFWECLVKARSFMKARRLYIRTRRWTEDDWYSAWNAGLGDEVEAAAERCGEIGL